MKALLAIIAAALVGILIVGVLLLSGAGDPNPESPERKSAREDAEHRAEYYCTLNGAAVSAEDLYSEEYKNCVEDETERAMKKWDANHPDDDSFK